MAIAASSVLPTNSLEDFRIEFNNLVSDVTGITATNKFDSSIIFEGSTADEYETTITITDPTADRTITIPNATGTMIVSGTDVEFGTVTPSSADGAALGSTSAEWSDLYLADGGVIYFGNDQDVSLTHVADTGLLLSSTDQLQFGDAGTYIFQSADGVLDLVSDTEIEINATTIDINGTANFSAAPTPATADGAALGSASLEWSDLYLADSSVIYFGNDQDITLTHAADTSLAVGGAGGTTGLIINNTATDGDPFLAFALSGTQTFTMGVDDGDSDKFKIGTTAIGTNTAFSMDSSGNVAITGDLTVTGDDLYMNTNTSGAVLVADGTNFNPVVVSGDATIATNGALTIAANAVEGSMLNNNTISGLTALTSGLATTDELMVSDGGTLKRMDASVLTVLTDGTATALAIALG